MSKRPLSLLTAGVVVIGAGFGAWTIHQSIGRGKVRDPESVHAMPQRQVNAVGEGRAAHLAGTLALAVRGRFHSLICS